MNRNRQIDDPWRPIAGRGFVRTGYRPGPQLEVLLDDKRAQHLFMPTDSHGVQFDCLAWPNIDGTFRLSRHDGSKIRYHLQLNAPGDTLRKLPGPPAEDHLYLHPRLVPKGLDAWNDEVKRRIPPTASRRVVVETIRNYVEGAREYVLPGKPGAADNLEGFLAGRGGGHCEYFATTMVVLLRLNKVPCRMVSGYLANEWDETGKKLTIRANHAHAWVEVWDPQRGWVLVDPTPARSAMADEGDSLWTSIAGFFERTWAAVTSFDGKARAELLAWAREQLVGAWTSVRTNPLTTVLLAAVLLWLRHRWRTRAQRRLDPDVRSYLGVLARLKLELRPGETPRQLLARADLPPERRELLATATAQHEAARYQ